MKFQYMLEVSISKVIPLSHMYVPILMVTDYCLTAVEFKGSAVPQPFLDPSIMQKRAQTEIELKEDQEKIRQ